MLIITAIIIWLNVTLLTVLVPGGPIENRDFSNLKGVTFWGFNVFLITLGLTSYFASYALLSGASYAIMLGKILAGLYVAVYLLDLGKVFPKSPTKMSNTLMLMEIVNTSFAILLFIFLSVLSM